MAALVPVLIIGSVFLLALILAGIADGNFDHWPSRWIGDDLRESEKPRDRYYHYY